jgi:hypothetical protein
MKRFKITIEETGQETRLVGAQWKQGAGESGEYGYTPEIETVRDYERTVYVQHIDSLDLAAVIAAVNTQK